MKEIAGDRLSWKTAASCMIADFLRVAFFYAHSRPAFQYRLGRRRRSLLQNRQHIRHFPGTKAMDTSKAAVASWSRSAQVTRPKSCICHPY